MRFVLDCSATMPWILRNDKTGYSENILRRLSQDTAIVPWLWYLEVGNVLLSAERKKRLKPAESERFLNWLTDLPIQMDEETPVFYFNRVLGLAREGSLSFYYGVYLELALRRGVTLATLDGALGRAAADLGVDVLGS